MAERDVMLSETFVHLADTFVDGFDVVERLGTLSRRCAEIAGAATAVLLVAPGGALQLASASSEVARSLGRSEVHLGEGPSFAAVRSRRVVAHGALDGTTPWPRFADAAVGLGHVAVHAVPMAVRGDVRGSVTMFMQTRGALVPADAAVAGALVRATTLSLLHVDALAERDRAIEQLQGALHSRVRIEQAKGAIAELAGIGVEDAFDRLRAYARRRGAPLAQVAASVVDRTMSEEALAELGARASALARRARGVSA